MGRPKKIISKRQKLRLNAKDIAVRAAKTFLQTFLASAGTILTLTSKEEQQAALIALVDFYRDWETDRKSTRLNSSHSGESRMPSSA